MSREEFRLLIVSIGFRDYNDNDYYRYKEFRIELFGLSAYDFYNGSKWIRNIYFSDLKPELKRLIRSYKLKQLLK